MITCKHTRKDPENLLLMFQLSSLKLFALFLHELVTITDQLSGKFSLKHSASFIMKTSESQTSSLFAIVSRPQNRMSILLFLRKKFHTKLEYSLSEA